MVIFLKEEKIDSSFASVNLSPLHVINLTFFHLLLVRGEGRSKDVDFFFYLNKYKFLIHHPLHKTLYLSAQSSFSALSPTTQLNNTLSQLNLLHLPILALYIFHSESGRSCYKYSRIVAIYT